MDLVDCLVESKKAIKYKRKNLDSVLYHTLDNNLVASNVRELTIIPKRTKEYFNDIFLMMVNAASTVNHDVYVSDSRNPASLRRFFDAVTTEMGRWDSIPGFLLYNSFPEKIINLHMKGCTCSSILNSCLRATFSVPVLKIALPENIKKTDKDYEIAYLLPIPSILGLYNKNKNGVQAIVRPTCFKMLIKK